MYCVTIGAHVKPFVICKLVAIAYDYNHTAIATYDKRLHVGADRYAIHKDDDRIYFIYIIFVVQRDRQTDSRCVLRTFSALC